MLVSSSPSSTYAPLVVESKRAGVPLYYAGAVCPKETYPPADPLQFCSTAYGATLDSQAALAFVKAQSKEPVRIGFATMAIPIARAEIEYAEQLAKTAGHDRGRDADHAAAAPDYTPFATRLKDANPELGVLVVAVGVAGAHLRGAPPPRLERPLHHLGPPQRGGGAGPAQGRQPLRVRAPTRSSRTTCRSTPRSARPRSGPISSTRPPIWPRASSPGWSPSPC